MINQNFKVLGILGIFCLGIFLTSCDKEDPTFTDSVENYVDGAIANLQDSSRCGRGGCFEFVFPIDISFPDGSSVSVDDYTEMRAEIQSYRDDNPDSVEKPILGYPLEVVSAEGEVISVANQEELRELRKMCRQYRKRKRGHRNHFCFKLVFPITLEFPDDTTIEVADRAEFKSEVRAWKAANPESADRPSLAFPITVEDKDGNQTEVASAEELDELKANCREDS